MYTASNDDFPFMTDAEVATYHEARRVDDLQRTATQRRAIHQWEQQPNLMTLADLMAKLKGGEQVSKELDEKLDELCVLAEFESMAS
jgi:hypothetical protein